MRSAYRGTDMNPGPNGVVTLRMHEMRPGRAPSIPRRRWCSHDRNGITARHLPLSCGQSLCRAGDVGRHQIRRELNAFEQQA